MKRSASAMWNGDLKTGKGTLSTDSGVLSNSQYSFSTRFEDGKGTNPEELLAAAHAGCFSMALSAQLGEVGLVAQSIKTTAAVTLEKTGGGFIITAVHLDLTAKIPGADPAGIRQGGGKREERVSRVQAVQRENHARQEARGVNRPQAWNDRRGRSPRRAFHESPAGGGPFAIVRPPE